MVNQRAEMGLVSHSTLTTGLFHLSWNCFPHRFPLQSFPPVPLPLPPTLHLNLAHFPLSKPFLPALGILDICL